jgi:hypothetical protein
LQNHVGWGGGAPIPAPPPRSATHYTRARPPSARDGIIPATASTFSPKAAPASTRTDAGHYRIRYDRRQQRIIRIVPRADIACKPAQLMQQARGYEKVADRWPLRRSASRRYGVTARVCWVVAGRGPTHTNSWVTE